MKLSWPGVFWLLCTALPLSSLTYAQGFNPLGIIFGNNDGKSGEESLLPQKPKKHRPLPANMSDLHSAGNLEYLAAIMNGMTDDDLPTAWGRAETYKRFENFIQALTPYILAPHNLLSQRLVHPSRPEALVLNCKEPKYEQMFNGEIRKVPAIIVDFIPFGWDLDLLEVRFLESYDLVDLFVVFESPYTQTGIKKPALFQASVKSTPRRWKQFMDKVLYFLWEGSAAEVDSTRQQFQKGVQEWKLEHRMRRDVVQLFRQSQDPRVLKILQAANNQTAYSIQADADEMPAGSSLLHLKHCETKIRPPFWTAPLLFKYNFHWLQHTHERRNLGHRWVQAGFIPSVKWTESMHHTGPCIEELRLVVAKGETTRECPAEPNFGPGGAWHLSSFGEPVNTWLKKLSVVDSTVHQAIPERLVHAVRTKSVTAELLAGVSEVICYGGSYDVHHVSEMDAPTSKLIYDTLPWAVKHNPSRYQQLLPTINRPACFQQNNCPWLALGDLTKIPKHVDCKKMLPVCGAAWDAWNKTCTHF
eukprot:g11837.t1